VSGRVVISRDGKTAIAGAAVVLFLLVAGRGAPAWYRWRSDARESNQAALSELAQASSSIGRADTIRAANRSSQLARVMAAPAFVNGSAPATAAASLASVVVRIAATSGLRISSLLTSSDSVRLQNGGIARVRVRVDGSGDVTAVTRFLSDLEGGLPIVAVRELNLVQEEPAAAAGGPESLRVGVVVEALARVDAAGPGR